MSTTKTIGEIPAGGPYRAVVTYANSATGEIKVKIPAILGTASEVSISYIGRFKQEGNIWSVPEVNSQIVVSSDDSSLTNVFWLQTDGVSVLEARVAYLEGLVNAIGRRY